MCVTVEVADFYAYGVHLIHVSYYINCSEPAPQTAKHTAESQTPVSP